MKVFASIRLTVCCLFWLGVLTFFGTLYQTEHGIYLAQERYFHSLIWMAGGFIPLPGGLLTMGTLFLNLSVSLFHHYQAGLRMPGLLLIHIGLMMMLAGGFMTRLTGLDATVSLDEGAGTNVAQSVDEWELALWKDPGAVREVLAYDLKNLSLGDTLVFTNAALQFSVEAVHGNAELELVDGEIASLSSMGPEKDPQNNMPAMALAVEGLPGVAQLRISGRELTPRLIRTDGEGEWFLRLQRKRISLPLFLELKDFRREYYPGSQDPKDYRSLITVHLNQTMSREVTVRMNHPFRMYGWTFFQSSFAVEGDSERSVFAATRNYGRLIPYVATGVTSLGLAMHFLQVQWMQRRRRTAA